MSDATPAEVADLTLELLAELLGALDGTAMMIGSAGLGATTWRNYVALRSELDMFGYPSKDEYRDKLAARLGVQL